MGYDPERFRRAFLPEPLPLALGEGYWLTEVLSDRLRSGIDLHVRAEDGRSVLVLVEEAGASAECLVRTGRLALSYYGDTELDDGTAARLTRRLADRIHRRERAVGADGVAGGLTVRTGGPVVRHVELRINRECNERCLFCNTPEDSQTVLPSAEVVYGAIARERAAGYDKITFTGRETTLDPELPGYLRAARDAGYRVVGVQSNGTTFAHEPLLRRLVDAGMNLVEVSLHTLDEDTFRKLVGPPGLLDKTLRGLANLHRTPQVKTQIVCVLTRMNIDHLPAVIERIAEVHPEVAQVTVSPMAPAGDGAKELSLVPRLAELREPLRRGLDVAERVGLKIDLPSRCGAPLCAMPPGTEHHNAEINNRPGQTLEAGKTKPATCRTCVYDPNCTGVWKAYLAHWGEHDVKPVRPDGAVAE